MAGVVRLSDCQFISRSFFPLFRSHRHRILCTAADTQETEPKDPKVRRIIHILFETTVRIAEYIYLL